LLTRTHARARLNGYCSCAERLLEPPSWQKGRGQNLGAKGGVLQVLAKTLLHRWAPKTVHTGRGRALRVPQPH
jgi:hypothetical protein